jgi:hypothetical protein
LTLSLLTTSRSIRAEELFFQLLEEKEKAKKRKKNENKTQKKKPRSSVEQNLQSLYLLVF